ncbi:MAG TPA: ATP-binding protein [Acidimicrobiales bacterium]|nr:ATP-binding protein [Acidimicrobiales bacterium]
MLDYLAAGCAWIRLAVADADDGKGWIVRNLEVVTGEEPPSWELIDWRYPKVRFLAEVRAGSELVEWLRGGQVTLDEHSYPIGSLNDQAHWVWSASLAPYGVAPLPWPSWTVQLDAMANYNEPGRPLVSDAAPSFGTFYDAASCVFAGGRDIPGGQIRPGIYWRHQMTEGRIDSVRIGDDMRVTLIGDSLDGTTVEVAGRQRGPCEQVHTIGREATLTFPVSESLQRNAWLVLKRGAMLMDRKQLASQYPYAADPGVEFAPAIGSRLEILIGMREGPTVEFKEGVPADDKSKKQAMKTVAAFANGEGGSLLFGVDDDYNVVGLAKQKVAKFVDDLSQIVDTWVEPPPPTRMEVLAIPDDDDHEVIELVVDPGNRLYCCGRQMRERRPYIRLHGRSVPARPEEIEAIVRQRSGQVPTNPFSKPLW